MKTRTTLLLSMLLTCQLVQAQENSQLTDYSYHGKETRESNNIIPLPCAKQLAFQDLEFGLFIHFGLSTYTGQSAGDGKQPASLFNPAELDCEQWMKVAKDIHLIHLVV